MMARRCVLWGFALAMTFWVSAVSAQEFGAATNRDYSSGQGTRLIGQEPDGKKAVMWFPTRGWMDKNRRDIERVSVDKGKLVGHDGMKSFPISEGSTVLARAIDGNTTVRYVVRKVSQPPTEGQPELDTVDTLYYTLVNVAQPAERYCRPAEHIWVNDKPSASDMDGGIQAVPVAEVWNAAGTEGINDQYFTMACMSGAVAKCYRWGYTGWRNIPDAKAHVQACTRMAMADYCGNGESHTVEGTPIRMYDFLQTSSSQHPAPSSSHAIKPGFETAWRGGTGPLPLFNDWNDTHEPPRGGALCLSKKRWDTITLRTGGLGCPQMADPRWKETPTVYKDKDATRDFAGEFCDYSPDGEISYVELHKAGALLVNRSPFLDGLLAVFADGGKDHWTTSQLMEKGVRLPDKGIVPREPVTPALRALAKRYVRDPAAPSGSVFLGEKLPRSVLDGLGAISLIPLRSYLDGQDDYVTTTGSAPPGTLPGTVFPEGWIYPCNGPQPPASVKLFRYVKNRGNGKSDNITTTASGSPALGTPAPNTPCAGGLEGYLPTLNTNK